jgi:hypothetical protein
LSSRALGSARRQIENAPIVGSTQSSVQPSHKLRARTHRRHALVLNGREDGAANCDLLPGISTAFGLARSSGQPAALGTQPRQAFVDRPQPYPNLFR